MSLANYNRPHNLDEFRWQEFVVANFKAIISKNAHSKNNTTGFDTPVNNILLTGEPSSGKSTLAQIYARTTLCKNREEGSYIPCGHCDVCTGKDVSNIFYHTITNPTESRPVIEQFIQEAKNRPIAHGVRADQYRRFFIIDEAELMSHQLISMLLDPLENTVDSTTWILITMDLAKLQRNQPTVAEAILSRCTHYALNSYTFDQIATVLSEKRDIEYEAAYLLAQYSQNLRGAWNNLSSFELLTEGRTITYDDITHYLLKGIDKAFIRQSLKELSEGVVPDLSEIDENLLCQQIIQYLTDDIQELSNSGINLLTDLMKWQSLLNKYPLKSILTVHKGEIFNQRLLLPLAAKKPAQVKVNDISSVLQKAEGKNALLKTNSYTELLAFL